MPLAQEALGRRIQVMKHESGDLPFQRRDSAERGIRQTGPTVSRRIQADPNLTGQCLRAVNLYEQIQRSATLQPLSY